ncbi:hypothetical protein Cob_v007788 [Colletotrichum orbiculare MAFF 240422]|uniref:Uncharacterized protein n=1 Tax=Colletotrichum orbiculare (strain 104-T / ATCC 96160 / CBS 514.97 / LARS 414 / MAFF 240422) TaxID=1213857 RepID=A0A484FNG6_COLOR|nr:hypothetical protein Cob_v007788 [Colletotrichum orbiculare MAFF 240422]
MEATQPRPAKGHDIVHDPGDLKLQPRGAITWPKSHDPSLPDALPAKGKISKVWRSLRQKPTLISAHTTGSHPPNGDASSVDEADRSKTQRDYPESVLSRATGTTLVGDDESVVSHAVSATHRASLDAPATSLENALSGTLQHAVDDDTGPTAIEGGADPSAGLPSEPALGAGEGLPRHWTFPGPSVVPLRPRVDREYEDSDDSTSTSSKSTVTMEQGTGADAIWRLDMAAPTPEAFLSGAGTYDLGLIKFIRQTLKDPQREDDCGRNGLHSTAASTYGRLKYLSSGAAEASASSRTRTWIHRALDDRRGDLAKATLGKAETYVFDLIEVGADVNAYSSFGNTVLMDFVAFVPEDADRSQDHAILQFLIDAGARLEARNRRGETALLVAARCGRRAAMDTLLRAGSRPEATDLWGRDALAILRHQAARHESGADSYADFGGCLAEVSSYSSRLAHGAALNADQEGGRGSGRRTSSRSLNHSSMDVDARTIRSTMTSSSSDSYAQEMSHLTDEMCGMILSRAFGSSMSEVSSPLEAWESVRRCLDELSILHHDGLGFENDETWETRTGEWKDDDAEPRHMSESRTGTFPCSDSSRKRGHDSIRHDEDSEGEENPGSRDGGGGGGRRNTNWTDAPNSDSKRCKTARISCPFRKRNPVKYNIRKHFNCATQSFPNISLVKRHVITHHKLQTARRGRTHICSRCQEPFETVAARDAHLRVPPDQICPLRDAVSNRDTIDDPEDGVTAEVVNRLRDRRSKFGVNTWDAVWAALFPDDRAPKSEDFEPIIEIDEVREAFEGNAHECASALQTVSSGMILDTSRVSPEGLGRLLWGLYQSFIHNTLQVCRDVLRSPEMAMPRRQLTLGEMAELRGVVVGDVGLVSSKSAGCPQSDPNQHQQSTATASRAQQGQSAIYITSLCVDTVLGAAVA